MDNRLYEFGGTADVLIKCKSPRTINGISYETNEPYTMLKDVVVQLQYSQNTSNATGNKPILSSVDGRPTDLIIGNIPLTKKVVDLIFSNIDKTYQYTQKEVVTCWENGKLELNYAVIDNVFCYDENFNKIIINFTKNSKIIEGNFIEGQQYLAFYTVENDGNVYNFEIPHYAYFSIEIFAKGNTDKVTNTLYMTFDAATLVSVPNFNIVNGGLLNTPLVFKLIYTNQKEPVVVFN